MTKKDFEIQTFRSGGAGGMNQNKVNSGVRIIHKNSGAVAEARDSRDQIRNKKSAFIKLTASKKFKDWLRLETARRSGRLDLAEKAVEKAMRPENIKVEFFPAI